MYKPIIIDGVDVSECEFYTDRLYTNCKSGCSAYADDCKSEYRQNCYYKQLQRLKAENEKLKQYKQSKQASYETMQTEWNKAINESRDVKAENEKYKQALEEVRELAKLIKDDDDKPACVYDEGCPLNGGAGFDNHCNMTCPYVLAKIIDDKINEVLKDENH